MEQRQWKDMTNKERTAVLGIMLVIFWVFIFFINSCTNGCEKEKAASVAAVPVAKSPRVVTAYDAARLYTIFQVPNAKGAKVPQYDSLYIENISLPDSSLYFIKSYWVNIQDNGSQGITYFTCFVEASDSSYRVYDYKSAQK